MQTYNDIRQKPIDATTESVSPLTANFTFNLVGTLTVITHRFKVTLGYGQQGRTRQGSNQIESAPQDRATPHMDLIDSVVGGGQA